LLRDKKFNAFLKPIDKYAIRFVKNNFSFEDFIREKEAKSNTFIYQASDSEMSLNEEIDLQLSDDEGKVSKLDLDKAYEMYLSKKQEIMKSYYQEEEVDIMEES
jgi:hypothetical protein